MRRLVRVCVVSIMSLAAGPLAGADRADAGATVTSPRAEAPKSNQAGDRGVSGGPRGADEDTPGRDRVDSGALSLRSDPSDGAPISPGAASASRADMGEPANRADAGAPSASRADMGESGTRRADAGVPGASSPAAGAVVGRGAAERRRAPAEQDILGSNGGGATEAGSKSAVTVDAGNRGPASADAGSRGADADASAIGGGPTETSAGRQTADGGRERLPPVDGSVGRLASDAGRTGGGPRDPDSAADAGVAPGGSAAGDAASPRADLGTPLDAGGNPAPESVDATGLDRPDASAPPPPVGADAGDANPPDAAAPAAPDAGTPPTSGTLYVTPPASVSLPWNALSIPCGPNTCNVGFVCCNESCGICVAPGDACPRRSCDGITQPLSVPCGLNTCNAGQTCCNPACGLCGESRDACSRLRCY